MAVTHSDDTRNALANIVGTSIDLGVGPNGTLEFQTAGDVEVATIQLGDPSFNTAPASGVGLITANATTDDTNATGNASPVTKFKIKDKDGNLVVAGSVTVTGGGGDIELSSVIIGAGATVSLTSLTYESAN